MSDVTLLIKGELYKFSKNKKLWLFLIFIVGVISISGIIAKTELDTKTRDWKVYIEKRLQDNYAILSQLENDETNGKYKKKLNELIMLDEYSLNKNIPPIEDSSAIGFVNQ
ncbi:hypothetical protein WJ0W_000414 [Paenibacillus melissococcoides]|uniref:ABC transporter permease n=1 Tax=Paenibacillus melissococcoides TaxID=2912268 RepID=A0ABM9FVK0_9BACL|nr:MULTISPECIES: hypothetical protein [Paenibacillus]MEB9897595.1 hypothetical protein [Bacillus cereus]CAH8243188.1 hypothetical protein WJ0W_000414 [Paenibacillus melissococcoides]CAH8703925.1 hypothetical protein WDD9_000407 [Paenibacillus melissococcoides]CAH8707044.1 hypothetical protein HTL2_001491 [Paenibacillus melissococcoides]GIO81804.1 hypothetical protein J6TS7_54140 [Paenibacillus dendritiformis]